jgi:hypothetical protein
MPWPAIFFDTSKVRGLMITHLFTLVEMPYELFTQDIKDGFHKSGRKIIQKKM